MSLNSSALKNQFEKHYICWIVGAIASEVITCLRERDGIKIAAKDTYNSREKIETTMRGEKS